MTHIIGISGKIGSGKNYLAEKLIEELHSRNYTITDASFAKPLKVELSAIINDIRTHADEEIDEIISHVADKFNMSQMDAGELYSFLITDIRLDPNLDAYSRTEGVRRALQHLGTDIRRATDHDYWVKAFHAAVPQDADFVFATDVRFPNEADSIKKVNGTMIRINVDAETIEKRTAERDGLQYSIDAKNHPSETVMDDYKDFDIIVASDFDAHQIVNQLIERAK